MSPKGFFVPKVDGHQKFDGNSAAVLAESFDADHFAEIFTFDGANTSE
jgi:hypothetical protein